MILGMFTVIRRPSDIEELEVTLVYFLVLLLDNSVPKNVALDFLDW